jgi:dihydropteroate synthase
MASKDTFFSKKTTLNCRGKLIDLSTPKVMGILNVTPDSFYDGGFYVEEEAVKRRIDRLWSGGADIVDVGACSTRPGAHMITAEEEKKRLIPALQYIRDKYSELIVSLDTCRAEVVAMAITDFRIDMVNDISAGRADALMLETVARNDIPFVMMHMQGMPHTMQNNPTYDNIVKDIMTFFSERLHQANTYGIKDIIIDPGFGFGKTIQHNYQLLRGLKAFEVFELPVMVGLSRKSMIYKSLEVTPGEALNGTTVVNTMALLNGANILRVHDVREAKEAVTLFLSYIGAESNS